MSNFLTFSQVTPRNSIVMLGDSLVDPEENVGVAYEQWTATLERHFLQFGSSVVVRNLGHSGAKTGGGQTVSVLNRCLPYMPQIYAPYTNIPAIGGIYSGANDTQALTVAGSSWSAGTAVYGGSTNLAGYSVGDVVFVSGYDQSALNGWQTLTAVGASSISAAVAGSGTPSSASGKLFCSLDTQTFIRAAIRWMEFGCNAYVQSPANLPAGGYDSQRIVVLYDNDSTGGRTQPGGSWNQLAQITGSITNHTVGNAEPTVWEWRSALSGAAGWCRVARASTTPTHVQKILVFIGLYLNWSSGGDTQSTQYTLWDSNVNNTVRYNQLAAISGENVAWVQPVNLFTGMSNYIATGIDTQGSFSWQIADQNLHPNGYGQAITAGLVFNQIQSLGWLSALS